MAVTSLYLTTGDQKSQAVLPPPDGGYPGFNTAEGQNALFSLTMGSANTAIGWFSLWGNAEGSFNTATGAGALLFNTANENTAFGTAALLFNTNGSNNTATGTAALLNNLHGVFNTAVGDRTLFSNIIGGANTATGFRALFNNNGDGNTAHGALALYSNNSGYNTAIGFEALRENAAGGQNTASGFRALFFNSTGSNNTASGVTALFSNNADNNTAMGVGALSSNTDGDRNIALGYFAGNNVTTANDVIAIGISGENVSNSCYIGQIYPNIQPQVGTDPDLVTINSDGRLGRANVSSRRYKHDIQPIQTASEAIYQLKPVSFRYHEQFDQTQTIAFGLIAEEVAEVNPDLVGRNREGQPESVRYEQVNAMLLNEFLKEHRVVEEQQAMIVQLKKEVATVVARLNEHDLKIQRVSDQVQLNSPESPLVVSDP